MVSQSLDDRRQIAGEGNMSVWRGEGGQHIG